MEMQVQLIIFGGEEFNPDALQEIVRMAPDRIVHLGEPIGMSWLKYKRNMWILTRGYCNEIDLRVYVRELLVRMAPCWDHFRYRLPAGCEVQLQVGAYVKGDESYPILNLDAEMVAKLAEIRASIDIDVIGTE